MKAGRDGAMFYASYEFRGGRAYLSLDLGVFAFGWAFDLRHHDSRWRIYKKQPIHARLFFGPLGLHFERDGMPDWTRILAAMESSK